MRPLFVILLFAHGLIHLMGFVKSFNLADVKKLGGPIARPAGVLWLVAAVLYCAAGILLFFRSDSWWMPGAPALLLSQILIILSWSDAKFGTVANIIIALPLVIAVASSLPSGFAGTYRKEVKRGLSRLSSTPLVREEDIRHLPEPVQRYLVYAGVVGKPRVQNVHAVLAGQMRTRMDGSWMDIAARQYDFFDEPTRVFFIESSMYGLPFDGLHVYTGPTATMQIKVASLFQVVDARGPEMNKGETVTMFNDMCVLAPASLIDAPIAWESVDSLTVRGRFTNAGNTITASLLFNTSGELIDFSSDDRYLSADGKTYLNYRWTTPVGEYKEYHGYRIASYGEAIWHTPGGDFAYAKFDLKEVEYNRSEFK